MKRIIALILACVMLMSMTLVGCGKDTKSTGDDKKKEVTEQSGISLQLLLVWSFVLTQKLPDRI